MGYDRKSLFECVCCLVCTCCKQPPYGDFTVGADYTYEFIIDAEKVTDDQGAVITFPESMFLSCFENFGEAITSCSPILSDNTEYQIYLILNDAGCSLEEIKAYAKVMNVNYLQARRVLTQKRNLIAAGSAYDILEILDRLTQFEVHYEIEPGFPYE